MAIGKVNKTVTQINNLLDEVETMPSIYATQTDVAQDIATAVANKADIDGNYPQMSVGFATNIITNTKIDKNGNEVAYEGASCTGFIPIAPTIPLTVNGTNANISASATGAYLIVYDGAKQKIDYWGSTFPRTFTPAANAAYIRVSFAPTATELYVTQSDKEIWNFRSPLITYQTTTLPVNLRYGTFATINGGVVTNDNPNLNRLTNFYKVGDAKIISVEKPEEVTSFYVFFYDESGSKVIDGYQYTESKDIAVPVTSVYIRLSFNGPETMDWLNTKPLITAYYICDKPCEVKDIRVSENTLIPFEVIYPTGATLNVLGTDQDTPLKVSSGKRYAKGALYLPTSYSPDGQPTRLIIYGHGSNYSWDTSLLATAYSYVQYLLAQGYAVAFTTWVCGSKDFAIDSSVGSAFFGTPLNYAVYNSFYKEIYTHFNIERDVFIFGKSQGGMQAYSLPYGAKIPTLASCSLAGVFTPLDNLFGYNDKQKITSMQALSFDGLETDNNGNITGAAIVMLSEQVGCPNYGNAFGMTDDRKAYLLSQADKLRGVMSGSMQGNLTIEDFINHYKSDSNEEWINRHPILYNYVPMHIMVAQDDRGIYNESVRAWSAMNNGNTFCRLRLFPSGMSDPHLAVDKLCPTTVVKTLYGGEMTVPISIVEMLDFFKIYER